MTAQDAHTGRMEGADPYTLCPKANQVIHTFPHFPGCFIGKSDRHDVPWIYPTFIDQISDPVGQDPCLSGTGACQYKKRAVCM